MRTTLILNDKLLDEAARQTGIREKTKLVHMGLQSILREEAIKRLIKLRGSYKRAKVHPREH